MDKAFLDCYEKIIHPAWRFFARNWHDHSEPLLMARVCFDLGSSAFRPEVAGGIKYILGEKVEWDETELNAFGHDECTMCTSRLIYVLSAAKRLFAGEDLERLSHNAKQKGLDQTVAGLLRYFRSREPEEQSWWGLGSEGNATRGVYSVDYLAWAARAVTFCRSVDQEVQARTGRSWLQEIGGATPEQMDELVQQRWRQLFSVRESDLLGDRTEESATFTLGRVALAVLDIQSIAEAARDLLATHGDPPTSFLGDLEKAKLKVWSDSIGQMSRLYMLPVLLVLDGTMQTQKEKEANALEIVKHCRNGMDSRIWIRKGADKGSWGFNVKNTQAIVTALMAFWRYAYEPANVDRFQEAFREPSSGPSAGPSPLK
jgi:hypothetical protein